MSNKSIERSLPVANYSAAIAEALKWLGDRYLLAQPINAVADATRSWRLPKANRERHDSLYTVPAGKQPIGVLGMRRTLPGSGTRTDRLPPPGR